MDQLERFKTNNHAVAYRVSTTRAKSPVQVIATTPQSRAIVNDPFLHGVRYTEYLKKAASDVLPTIRGLIPEFGETNTVVLNILRGGLNFGLRDALFHAFGWNKHASAFISAQRARATDDPEEWYITEHSYEKVYLPKNAVIVFGDVVATGTSLAHGLRKMVRVAEDQGVEISSFVFFTIGSPRAEEILREIDNSCRDKFPSYQGSLIVYFEGRFDVAEPESRLSIKLTGTDLLRSNSLLAPEFIESQYESPSYPIERCTIYDAGSRAFWLPEYLEDVTDYWEQTLQLAKNGMTFEKLLGERFPELEPSRFGKVDLANICRAQISKAHL